MATNTMKFFIKSLLFLFLFLSLSASFANDVGVLSITGAPDGATFSLVTNPGGHFSIQGNEITAAPDTPAGNYSITVQADGNDFSTKKTFVLNFAGIGPPSGTFFIGLNLSGMEDPVHPTPPTIAEISYLTNLGFLIYRLPINWINIQPIANGPLDLTYVATLHSILSNFASFGAQVVIDFHNFGGGPGGNVGSPELPISAFVDGWNKVVAEFGSSPGLYGIDLMNEPTNGQSSTLWQQAQQAVITSIRSPPYNYTGWIYCEGVNFTSAWNWVSGQGQSFNNIGMIFIDPINKTKIESHSYLDRNSSGTHFSYAIESTVSGASPPPISTNSTIGVTRLTSWINWLAQHGQVGNLGEMGTSSDAYAFGGNLNYTAWNVALDNSIALAKANNVEFWYWGAGPNFGAGFLSPSPGYGFNPEPFSSIDLKTKDYSAAGVQAPQMAVLRRYSETTALQPTAYALTSPMLVTSTGNPEAPSVSPILYGSTGVASAPFTVYYGGKIISPVTITPHATLIDGTSAGGIFTPTSLVANAGENFIGQFTYTPNQAATIQIATTNNVGWTNPPVVGFSSVADPYSALDYSKLTNMYPMFNRFTPNIGPSLRLQRVTDNQQMDWSMTLPNSAGQLGYDRVAIQTWASQRSGILVLKRYDTSGHSNHMTMSGGTLPTLNLNNSAGYPEIVMPSGTQGDFNSPINGQTAFTSISRYNQTSGGLWRQDQFLGPIIWGTTNFSIVNTGWIGQSNISSSSTVSAVSLGQIAGSYHEYSATYAAGLANGTKTYIDGTLNAQASPVASTTAQFTSTQTGTTLTVTNQVGQILIGDTVNIPGIGNETILSGGNGIYQTNTSGNVIGVTSTCSSITYTINAAFSSGSTQYGYFRFGPSPFIGSDYSTEIFNGLALSSAQNSTINTMDAAYYSTSLPDTLPAVPPTIIAGGIPNNVFNSISNNPFNGVTIQDQNNGSPTDSLVLTLSGAAATLTGSGITGSNPYNIAAASAVSVTTTLKALTLNTSATPGLTINVNIAATSSAGSSSSISMMLTVQAYVAETSYAAPIGSFTPVVASPQASKGYNLYGMENTGFSPPGIGYPRGMMLDYLAAKGFSNLRLPITSQLAYTNAFGLLNAGYLANMKIVIDYAFTKNLYVIIDPHNFGGIWDSSINGFITVTSDNPRSSALFSDLWRRLSTKFLNYPNVIFGLMNEPNGVAATKWRDGGVIPAGQAIRATGATQLITIPGTSFTGVQSWTSSGNAAAFANFNSFTSFVFEMHGYLDSGAQGISPIAVSNGSTFLDISPNGLANTWLVANGFQAVLYEFGIAPDPYRSVPNTSLTYNTNGSPNATGSITQNGNMLTYMQSHSTQWPGWSAQAGGFDFATIFNNDAASGAGGYGYNPEPPRVAGGFQTSYIMPIIDSPQVTLMLGYLP